MYFDNRIEMVSKKEKTPKETKEGERKSSRAPKTVERLNIAPAIAKKKTTTKSTKPKTTKATTKKKSTTKKAKKDGPKRPVSAYLLFSKDHRAKISKANPDADFGEIGRLVGESWQNATAAEKKKYEAQAAKDKERYEKEKAKAVCYLPFIHAS